MEFLGSVSLLSSPSPTSSFEPLFNLSSSSSSSPSLSPSPSTASTALFCFLLSLLSLLGIVGNLYTIGLLLLRRRGNRAGRRRRLWGSGGPSSASESPCCCCCLPGSSFSSPSLSPSSSPTTSSYSSSSSSLHLQVLSLALADLLYLSTAPFIVYDSLTPDWGFGEVGCRLLLSLDLLTMHASIFTLTAMSMDRYRAVADPLAASVSPSSGLLKVVLAWGVAVALSLPMMITLHLEDSGGMGDGGMVGDVVGVTSGDGDAGTGTRMLCVPAWDEQSSKTYLTILFCTSILAPGLAIGGLYSALAVLYWRSQSSAAWSSGQDRVTPRTPRPKVLLLILGIVLAFWACFLPFWVWQLLPLYREDFLPSVPVSTQVTVNRILTGLTYGNSCVNPFFYTLLTGKRSRRNRQTISSSAPLCQKTSSIR